MRIQLSFTQLHVIQNTYVFRFSVGCKIFKPSRFLFVRVTNSKLLPNLRREIFHPRVKFQILWIPIEITGCENSPNNNRCGCTFRFMNDSIHFVSEPNTMIFWNNLVQKKISFTNSTSGFLVNIDLNLVLRPKFQSSFIVIAGKEQPAHLSDFLPFWFAEESQSYKFDTS